MNEKLRSFKNNIDKTNKLKEETAKPKKTHPAPDQNEEANRLRSALVEAIDEN